MAPGRLWATTFAGGLLLAGGPAVGAEVRGGMQVTLQIAESCRVALEPPGRGGHGSAAPVVSCNADIPRRTTILQPPPRWDVRRASLQATVEPPVQRIVAIDF